MTFINWIWGLFKGDYWKQKDSYKNSLGEGLLERYTRNFGAEIDDNMYPFIGQILDFFNPIIANRKYLQYMAVNVGIQELSGDDLIDSKLIAWAITLYKRKGTSESYRMLFNLFGLGIIIDETFVGIGTHYDGDGVIYDDVYFYDDLCPITISYNIGYYKYNDACGTSTAIEDTVIPILRRLICLVQPIDARLNEVNPILTICDSWEPDLTEDVPITTEALIYLAPRNHDGSFKKHAISQFTLHDPISSTTITFLFSTTLSIINDSSQETIWIAHLDNVRFLNGLLGSITINTDNKVIYTNAPGEHYTNVTDVIIMTAWIIPQFDISGSGLQVKTLFKKGKFIINWGDSSPYQYFQDLTGVLTTMGHTYSSGTTVSAEYFHNNAVDNIRINDLNVGISGFAPFLRFGSQTKFPSLILKILQIQGNNFTDTNLTINFSQQTSAVMESLFITDNGLWATVTDPLFNFPMPAISDVHLNNNALTSTILDNAVNNFVLYSWDGSSPIIWDGSGNAGAYTSASLASRNALIAAGGTVT